MQSAIEQLPAVQAMFRSINDDRFPHAVLIQGEAMHGLEAACGALAARLLSTENPTGHPDFHSIRPSDRMRRIGVDAIRDLTRQLSRSANQSGAKCAAIIEAERMSVQAANAFLKTLEEPGPQTYLFLLSERPYDLLPTIRSRCLNLRVPALRQTVKIEGWQEWLHQFKAWLGTLISQKPSRTAIAEWTLALYGMICRYQAIVESAQREALSNQMESGLSKEQKDALEVLIKKSVRDKLWADISIAARDFSLLETPEPEAEALGDLVDILEQCAGLLEVNFAEDAALEIFLLHCMRVCGAKQ